MKLLFCDSFTHSSATERAECINFVGPVIVSAVRVVADKSTAHSGLPTPAETRPIGFNLEVCAAPFSSTDAATFAPILTLYDCGRTDAPSSLHPPILTDRIVIRGTFEALTLCVYGERITQLSKAERLPLEELDARLLSEESLLSLAQDSEGVKDVVMTKVKDEQQAKKSDAETNGSPASAEVFVRQVDETRDQPALRRGVFLRLLPLASSASFATLFAQSGGMAALLRACEEPPISPSLLALTLEIISHLLDQPSLIGRFLSPDARSESPYRLLAHLLSTRASASSDIVKVAEQILLRCHLFEHCTNLARSTEETAQAASSMAALTPISQCLESLNRILLLLRSQHSPTPASALPATSPLPPSSSVSSASLLLSSSPSLPIWLSPLLRSLKLYPNILLLLSSPRLREQPTRLAAIYQVVRDLTLALLVSRQGTLYFASEARSLVPLLCLLEDNATPIELSGSLYPLCLFLARPERCTGPLLSALVTAHLRAFTAAATFARRAAQAGANFASATSSLVEPLESLLNLCRVELGRHAAATALQWHNCAFILRLLNLVMEGEKILLRVLQRGVGAVGGLLATASLSLLLYIAHTSPSISINLFRLFASDSFASLDSLALPTDLSLSVASLTSFLSHGHAFVSLPIASLLNSTRDALNSADKREAAVLCLRAAIEQDNKAQLSLALRSGLPSLLASIITNAATAMSGTHPHVLSTDLHAWLSGLINSLPLLKHCLTAVPFRASLTSLYVAIASLLCSPLDLDGSPGMPRDGLPDLALAVNVLGIIEAQFVDWITREAELRQAATLSGLIDDLQMPRSGAAMLSLVACILSSPSISASPPRLFEPEIERAAVRVLSWLSVSSRSTFIAAMRVLHLAATLSANAASAAVKGLKTLMPTPNTASATEESPVHRVAFAAFVLARTEHGRTALLASDCASWLALYLPSGSTTPSLRTAPIALAVLSSLLSNASDESIAAALAPLASALSATTDARLSAALLALFARLARRASVTAVVAQQSEALLAATKRVCSTPTAEGALECIAHLAALVHSLNVSAPALATAVKEQLSRTLASYPATPESAPLKMLANDVLANGNLYEDDSGASLPWEMCTDAFSDEYFGGAVPLDAAIAAEVQRVPESKAALAGSEGASGASLLGKRLSVSDMCGDTAADKKKAATAEASSASVFASVVAYATASRSKAADAFRNRRPNTSRQPSRHVDDFQRPKGAEMDKSSASQAQAQPTPHAAERRYDFREPMHPERERSGARDMERDIDMDRGRYDWLRPAEFLPDDDLYRSYPMRGYEEPLYPPDRYHDDAPPVQPYWRAPPPPPYRGYYD